MLYQEDIETGDLNSSAVPGFRIPGDKSVDLTFTLRVMSDEAYQALVELDLSDEQSGNFHWNPGLREWRRSDN